MSIANFNYSHLNLDFSDEAFFTIKRLRGLWCCFSHRLRVFTYLLIVCFGYVWLTVALHCYCVVSIANRLEAPNLQRET